MIEAQFGAGSLVDMLMAYRDGLSTPQVFAAPAEPAPGAEGFQAREGEPNFNHSEGDR